VKIGLESHTGWSRMEVLLHQRGLITIIYCKMHSRCFGIMEGHENFVFNLVVKLSVELGYSFLSLRL
jgi:hypothetical protein